MPIKVAKLGLSPHMQLSLHQRVSRGLKLGAVGLVTDTAKGSAATSTPIAPRHSEAGVATARQLISLSAQCIQMKHHLMNYSPGLLLQVLKRLFIYLAYLKRGKVIGLLLLLL
ncbi:hypothetical protein MHYP_G00039300 [Metynnis hypsauchen]